MIVTVMEKNESSVSIIDPGIYCDADSYTTTVLLMCVIIHYISSEILCISKFQNGEILTDPNSRQ